MRLVSHTAKYHNHEELPTQTSTSKSEANHRKQEFNSSQTTDSTLAPEQERSS